MLCVGMNMFDRRKILKTSTNTAFFQLASNMHITMNGIVCRKVRNRQLCRNEDIF